MYIQIIILVLQAILIFIVLYFKSYFSEKGKNIATSEDIEELTLKVESVKQNFIEKNAIIKSELDILVNIQTGYKTEKRLAILEFHKKFSLWIELHTIAYIPLIDESNEQEIKEKLYSYDKIYQDLLIAKSLLEIYVEDEELFKIVRNLKMSILENLGMYPKQYLFDIRTNNKINQIQNGKVSITEVEELYKKRMELMKQHQKTLFNWLKDNIHLKNEYNNYIRNYIKNL